MDLATAEIELSRYTDSLLQSHSCLKPIRKSTDFDVIILDSPPALGLLSMNGLAAADYLLIPLEAKYLAMESLITDSESNGPNQGRKLDPQARVGRGHHYAVRHAKQKEACDYFNWPTF